MMYYRKFVKNILISALVPFLSLIAAIIIIDPLQVFHKSWIHPGKYCKNFRESLYGIVKYEDFDSVIIGSSMTNNFSADEASQNLGGKFINISMGAFSSGERKILLKYLLNSKKIKIIINSFDVIGDAVFINNYNLLYGDFFDRLNFYFNAKTADLILTSVKNRGTLVSDFNHPIAWYQNYNFGLNTWIEGYLKGNLQSKSSLKLIIDAMKLLHERLPDNRKKYNVEKSDLCLKIIDEHFVGFIKEHKNTLFILFLPPWSKVAWKSHALSNNELQYNEFEVYKARIKHLVTTLKNCNNAIIFGFDNEAFTRDINRYIDAWHYDEKVNSFMLKAMRNRTHILTPQNVDAYLEKFEKDVINYDIKPLYEQIKSFKGLRMLPC